MEGPFSPSRHLAILGDALISNVLFESWLQGHLTILGQRSNLKHPCLSHGQRVETLWLGGIIIICPYMNLGVRAVAF